MSLTVTQMQTYVSQLLSDTGNTKWTNANYILPALNTAQEEFVIYVLSFASQNRQAFEMLSELEASTSQSVGTSGYALSGIDSSPGPFMRNGFIAAKATIDGEDRWFTLIPAASLQQQQNQYARGSDERPLCYVFNETFYVLVDSGTYPVTATIYYIREPKELVASGASGYQATTCEINGIYHRLICEIAAANCWKLLGDTMSLNKYQATMDRVQSRIRSIATTGIVAEKQKEIEI